MRGKKKTLDDFFAKDRSSSKAQRGICDISLCTATTRKVTASPTPLCTLKRNPNAFKLVPQRMGLIGGLSSLSEITQTRQNLCLMPVKEESTSRAREFTTSSFGGVTLGMGQLLYTQKENNDRKCIHEERTDIESTVCSDETIVSGSVTVNDYDQSIEVSMSGFEFSVDEEAQVSSLGKKGARMMKEAKLAEQKIYNEENEIAAQRRFLEMEHSEFQCILKEFRERAQREEERRKEEEARLAERRRLLNEAYLKEQARLLEAEERLVEESRKAAEATKLILERSLHADSDSFIEEQISRSLSNHNTLGVLSETTWENEFDDDDNDDNELYENQSLGKHHWNELNASEFKVRGENYFEDKKKVHSQPNLFRLITVDLIEVSEPIMSGFCCHPKERVQRWLQQEKQEGEDSIMPPFVFCVNMVLPGPPYYHLVMYFGVDDLSKLGLKRGSTKHPYSSSLRQFLFGDSDELRNKMLKFIPQVKEGSFLLKTAVGTKPFILGNYLDQRFIKGDRYLEVIADIGSSITFQKLLRLSSNYSSKISGAMAFVLEASNEASLPENIMCSVELTNQDFDGNIRFVDAAEDNR